MLSVNKGCKAVCAVVSWQCNWLQIFGKHELEEVQICETAQDGDLEDKSAVAFVRKVAQDRLSLLVMPTLWLAYLILD